MTLIALLQDTLNEFLGLGKPAWQEARQTLQRLLSSSEGHLRDNASLRQAAIIPLVSCKRLQALDTSMRLSESTI